MSADEQEAAKAKVHFDYTRTKQRYDLLRNEAVKISKDFDGWSKALKDKPETITFNGNQDAPLFKDYKGLGKLVDDLKTTRDEARRLEEVMRKLGLSDLLKD